MVILPQTLGQPTRSSVLLGLALGVLLTLETGQILRESTDFAPNLGGPRMADVRHRYWPESPVPRDEEADPLADWLGLARFLPEADLTAAQREALAPLQGRAARAAAEALDGYSRLLEPLTPYQRERLLAPQPRVVDHRALGLDSVGPDLQVLWLHEMDLHAAGAKTVAPALQPPPSTWRLPPTRLAVSMRQLLQDAEEPLTPEQARAVLDRMVLLRNSLFALHSTHHEALSRLTEEQRAAAGKRELRRWEALPSPQALEELVQLLGAGEPDPR